jgi:pimeloyl-ACP methyl ester carboxylesterase
MEDKYTGFQACLFTPVVKISDSGTENPDSWVEKHLSELNPVVAFRGSDSPISDPADWGDNFNPSGVAAYQFAMNEAKILKILSMSLKNGRKPDVVGHSKGGALAQIAAARYGGLVTHIITFQSPGIDTADALSVDSDTNESTHYRASGDVVSRSGERVTPGTTVELSQKGIDHPGSHLDFLLSQVNNNLMFQGKEHIEDLPSSEPEFKTLEILGTTRTDANCISFDDAEIANCASGATIDPPHNVSFNAMS